MDASMNVPSHHVRQEVCTTRPVYREGRNPKAVKVYTVNLESRYLLVQGVPAVGATQELIKLFALYGAVEEYRHLDDYPTTDKFTDVYFVKFERIQAARIARRKLDDWSFFGGVLHVCYAPEHETVEETRLKLQDRRKGIAARIRRNEAESSKSKVKVNTTHPSQPTTEGQRSSSQGQRSSSQGQRLNSQGFSEGERYKDHTTSELYNESKGRGFNPRPVAVSQNDLRVSPQPYMEGSTPMEEKQQLWIPPPPKESAVREGMSGQSVLGYEYARVRTAHSVYPANYDARLSADSDSKLQHYGTNTSTKPVQNGETSHDQTLGNTSDKKHMARNSDFKKFLQKDLTKGDNSISVGKVTEGGVTDHTATSPKVRTQAGVLVRDFKPQSAPPKFVPRQMMNLSKKTGPSSVNTVKDRLNKELCKNALTLGEIHGPVLKGEDRVQNPREPTVTERSVEKTRTEIRKRVSMLTGTEGSSTEKSKKSKSS